MSLPRRNAALPLLLVASLVPCLVALPDAARAGSLKGQVLLSPSREAAAQPSSPPPLAFWRVENGLLPPAPSPSPEARGEVVLVLEPLKKPEAPPPPVTLSARPLHLEPRVAVGQVGATVTVKNEDTRPRTFFLENGDLFMPRETTAPGGTREVKFTEPGTYRIADADHPHGASIVLMAVTPYYGRADDKGAFTIEAPDGKYILKAWHRGVWNEGQPVEIGRSKDVVVKLVDRPASREKK